MSNYHPTLAKYPIGEMLYYTALRPVRTHSCVRLPYPKPTLHTIRPNPAQEKNKRCAAKHPPLRTFLYWHCSVASAACGAVLMLNVANVIMLPIPMLPIINLSRHPHWELKIETGWSRAFRLGVFDADAPSSNRACGFPAHGFPCETDFIGNTSFW